VNAFQNTSQYLRGYFRVTEPLWADGCFLYELRVDMESVIDEVIRSVHGGADVIGKRRR
jgi:hypothetical protein